MPQLLEALQDQVLQLQSVSLRREELLGPNRRSDRYRTGWRIHLRVRLPLCRLESVTSTDEYFLVTGSSTENRHATMKQNRCPS